MILMAMFLGEGSDEVHDDIPGEVATAKVEKSWDIFFDGFSYDTSGEARVVFESP